MKRFWSTRSFVAGQKIRARQRERRRRSSRRLYASFVRETTSLRVDQEPVSLKAPKMLKLFSQPDATLAYCSMLRSYLARPGTTVFLDFSEVESFTTDSLLLIRSVMDRLSRARQTHVRGNLPSKPGVAAEFKASGFFSGFAKPPADLPEPRGIMLKKSANVVHSKVAADMVDFARKHTTVTKPCADACFQTLSNS